MENIWGAMLKNNRVEKRGNEGRDLSIRKREDSYETGRGVNDGKRFLLPRVSFAFALKIHGIA